MNKAQVNKLGKRLALSHTLEPQALDELQALRAEYDAPMLEAQRRLEAACCVPSTARLKTINTIIEKLRRAKTRLAEMQDIAGLRIVRDMTLTEQDALVGQIGGAFPGAKVVDRRDKPSFGYRAVHVIARVDGIPIEIQVRTELQDGWAQTMEKLADNVGRDIRYGGPPQIGGEAARDLVEMLIDLSEKLRSCETYLDSVPRRRNELREHEDKIRELTADVEQLSPDDPDKVEMKDRLRRLQQSTDAARQELADNEERTRTWATKILAHIMGGLSAMLRDAGASQ